MVSRAYKILLELRSFAKYVPGKPIKSQDNKDIAGSTALSSNSSVRYDSDNAFGGHFIERYGLNDSVEHFQLTHENAKHLLTHLKKYVAEHEKEIKNKDKVKPNAIIQP